MWFPNSVMRCLLWLTDLTSLVVNATRYAGIGKAQHITNPNILAHAARVISKSSARV